MKKLNFQQPILLLPLVAAIGLLFTACSSDDEMSEDVAVDFYLSNEQGERTTEFKSTDNIVFNLSIKNNSNKKICLYRDNAEMEKNLLVFAVYDSEGMIKDTPWDSYAVSDANSDFLDNNVNWKTCWMNNKVENVDTDPFCVESLKEQLPRGEYYTLFSFFIDNELKTYKINFRIV